MCGRCQGFMAYCIRVSYFFDEYRFTQIRHALLLQKRWLEREKKKKNERSYDIFSFFTFTFFIFHFMSWTLLEPCHKSVSWWVTALKIFCIYVFLELWTVKQFELWITEQFVSSEGKRIHLSPAAWWLLKRTVTFAQI